MCSGLVGRRLEDTCPILEGLGCEVVPARETEMHLLSFDELPLGARFRYPGEDGVWTVLRKWRNTEGGPMSGTISEWRPDMLSLGYWPGQRICSHIPEECPDMVKAID